MIHLLADHPGFLLFRWLKAVDYVSFENSKDVPESYKREQGVLTSNVKTPVLLCCSCAT